MLSTYSDSSYGLSLVGMAFVFFLVVFVLVSPDKATNLDVPDAITAAHECPQGWFPHGTLGSSKFMDAGRAIQVTCRTDMSTRIDPTTGEKTYDYDAALSGDVVLLAETVVSDDEVQVFGTRTYYRHTPGTLREHPYACGGAVVSGGRIFAMPCSDKKEVK